MRHQLSYSLLYLNNGEGTGIGDALLNYRFQLREETAGGPAISPRLSLILPTGREDEGLGEGSVGVDLNLPVSKQFGDFYLHANAGYTWLPDVPRTHELPTGLWRGAASGIWRVAPMLNLMLEGLVEFGQFATVSPGFRRGWNFGERQLVERRGDSGHAQTAAGRPRCSRIFRMSCRSADHISLPSGPRSG